MGIPGGWELILILAVLVLLFGASKLPNAARSIGQSMRIFKAETKGLRDDDDKLAGSDAAYVQTPVAPAAPVGAPAPLTPAPMTPAPMTPPPLTPPAPLVPPAVVPPSAPPVGEQPRQP